MSEKTFIEKNSYLEEIAGKLQEEKDVFFQQLRGIVGQDLDRSLDQIIGDPTFGLYDELQKGFFKPYIGDDPSMEVVWQAIVNGEAYPCFVRDSLPVGYSAEWWNINDDYNRSWWCDEMLLQSGWECDPEDGWWKTQPIVDEEDDEDNLQYLSVLHKLRTVKLNFD